MADEMTIGKLLVQLLLDDDQYGEDLQKAKASTQKFGVDLSYLADMLNDMVTTAFKAATAAAVGFAAASAVVGATFESKMQTVGVIAGATADEMAALETKARDLGATTNYSASDAADAMQLLAGAGLDTNEVLTATGDALNLAGAGGTSLDVAAASLTSTMSQFSLQTDQAGRIADVFAASTAKSQFTVEDLSEAMKYGGTVGAGFGWSLEQTVAALAQFRDMGLVGASAGTALRSAMVGATTASEKNIKTMEKYGLTMADINPETHSFASILETVGKAGITTSDSMVVFGSEAGAVISTLAEKFAAGESSYNEMLSSLENSTGTATSMYAQMTDTVLGRFQNLQSAVEEFFLTLFDQYSEPILGLLDAMSNVVNRISQEVQGRSGEIQASLADAFGAVTDWLNDNADYIASSIAGFIRDLAEFATEVRGILPILTEMLPLVDDLVLAMGLLWVTTKVAAFASAIGGVVSALSAAGGGVQAFMVVLTEATGGIYALVAAIGTLIAGLVYLVNRYLEAESAANRLKEAQERLAAQAAAEDRERLNQLETMLDAQQMAARAELAHSETLSKARKKELEQIVELTAQEALRLEQQGKLVEIGGELRQVGSIVDDLDPKAWKELDDTIKSLRTDAYQAGKSLDDMKKGLEQAQARIEAGTEASSKMIASTLHFAGFTADSMEAAQAEYDALAAKQAGFTKRAAALETERAKAVGALREGEAKEVDRLEQSKLSSAEKALTEGVKQERTHADKVLEIRRKMEAELAAMGADELDRVNIEMSARSAELKAAYDVEIKAAGNNEAEKARLEEAYRKDAILLMSLWAAKRQEIVDKNAEDEAKKREDTQKRVNAIISGLEEHGMKESEKLEREKAEVLAGIASEYGEERTRIAGLYDAQISEARVKESEDASDAEETGLEKFMAAMRKAGAVAKDVWNGITTVVDSTVSAIDTVTGAASDFIGFFADGLETLTGFSFDLFDAITAVVDAMEAAKENGVTLTGPGGMEVSTGGVMSNPETASSAYVNGLVEAAVAFVETAIAAVPTLIQALVDGLPTLITALVDAIPQVVESLAAALPGLVDMFVTEAPRVIQALVDALPTLVQGIVDAIPTIFQFIIDTLPMIIQPLMDAAQSIMDALIEEVPKLIVAIIGMIPDIIKDILAHLPEVISGLIDGVVQIIVAIVQALPEIITNIIDAIPGIITSLITALTDAIPVIVMAVIQAIPEIISGVLQGIPEIISSILGAIPGIISMVVELIPDIITGIVASLPEILGAIIELIPELIAAIIVALPDIIIALIEGLAIRLPVALAGMLWEAIEWIWDGIVGLLTGLWEDITGIKAQEKKESTEPGLFDEGGAIDDFVTSIFGGDEGSAYSGINYVPATMRMTVHPGEAVIPASRNPFGRGRGRADTAMAGGSPGGAATGWGGAQGGAQRVELAIIANGRDIDRVVVESMGRGQATEIKRTVRTMSGLKAGLDRGRYNRWNK